MLARIAWPRGRRGGQTVGQEDHRITEHVPLNSSGGSAIPFRVALVSTCPPRQCGIATFSSDLARALRAADPGVRVSWVAINEAQSAHTYGPEVLWCIRQDRPDSYEEAAVALNESNVDLVSLQHEFGLYGIWGETFEDHLEAFLETLRKPLVTTLHSVVPSPSPSVAAAVRRITGHSRAVVVMAHRARQILEQEYDVDPARVYVIAHGVPPTQRKGRHRMKERLGMRGRPIISTFGLVDPRKGLEYMIGAMSEVAVAHPDALYLILGKTHPELVRSAGERYRAELAALVQERGLDGNVAFVDEYLSQGEIVDYLLASDVYVTPYLDPNQITSGTLSYALGAGKAIISTPYPHAVEALADERGILVDFRSERGLAEAVLGILDDPELKERLERNAYESGRLMAWPLIGESVMRLYRSMAANSDACECGQLAVSGDARTGLAELP